MGTFILRRLLTLVPTLLVIIVLSFVIIRFSPGSPFASERGFPPEVLAELRAKYGFDKTVPQQLMMYMSNLARGDLGHSTKYPAR